MREASRMEAPPRDPTKGAASCGDPVGRPFVRTAVVQIQNLQTRSPEKTSEAMSRRTTTIEEEFDDDTTLPLPRALPNTGTRGAILEEIGIDSDREDDEDNGYGDDDPDLMELNPQPSATGSASHQEGSNSSDRPIVTDIKPYKS